MKYHVTVRRGVTGLAPVAITAIVILTLSTSTNRGLGLSTASPAEDCRSFQGETVQAVAWSRDGRFLGVSTRGNTGSGTTRVFMWPGMEIVTKFSTDLDDNYVAMSDDGTVYWMTSDTATPPVARLWRAAIGSQIEDVGVLPGDSYISLTWSAGALVALQAQATPVATRLVSFASIDPIGQPIPLTDWSSRAADPWIDRAARWMTWIEPSAPSGEQAQIVVQHGDQVIRVPLPGYGGRQSSLSPAHDEVIYQRSETAKLTVVSLATREVLGELDDRQYYGGEVSTEGVLAGLTANGPSEANELCVLDVRDRLAELAANGPQRMGVPPLIAEDIASRDAVLAMAVPGARIDLASLISGDWDVVSTFHPWDDSVTALDVLGQPFDLEGAVRSLGGKPGTIVVTGSGPRVVGWFAIPSARLDVPFAGGGFGRGESKFDVLQADPPYLVPASG